MNNRLLIAAFVSICFLSGSCKISSGQGSRYDFSSLDSVIQGWVDKGYYPGASICVVKNDTVIFQKNYRDYTPDTKYMSLLPEMGSGCCHRRGGRPY